MKIGFFTDSYLPIKYGMEASIESFRINLEKLGHEAYVYAPYFPGYRDENPRVFRFRSWQPSKKMDMRFSLPLSKGKTMKEVRDFKLDIIHAETPFSLGLLGQSIGRRQKIPVIYTHHTDFPGCIRAYIGNTFFLADFSERLTAWFSNRCDAVIAPSEKIRLALLKSGVRKPIHVVPNGVDLERFAPTDASQKAAKAIREKYGISSETKLLITLSRVGKEKNLDLLVDGMAEITKTRKDIKLMIVGKGPHLAGLKEKAGRLNLGGQVIFTGFIPDDEKPSYYQAGDVFVYGSFHDVHPVVVLEAIANGLPVITVDDAAFYGMVENGRNGYLLNAATPAAFAEKAILLLDNGEMRKKFQKASLEIAAGYSEQKMAEKAAQVYQEAIAKKMSEKRPRRMLN